jgi:hypothetical protein
MAHNVGIALSIVGLWLASAGVIGDSRLREWEARIRAWIRSENVSHRRLRGWAMRVYGTLEKDETHSILTIAGYLRNIIVAMVLLVIVIGALAGSQQIDTSVLNCFGPPMLMLIGFVLLFLGLILFLTLAGYLMAAIAWIVILPYHLLDRFVERARLQSTLVVIGLILGTLGILLTG